MAKKALATGNEVEIEDEINPEAVVSTDMTGEDMGEITQESEVTEPAQASDNGSANEQQTSEDAAQVEADLEAAGVNIDAQDDKRTKNRQKKALLKKVGDIGEAYGAGKTSMIELAQEVTEAAVNRTIGESDAEDLYKTFRARADKRATITADDGGVVVPDEVAVIGSLDQQVSKLRTFIKLGNGFDEGVDIVERAIAVHLRAKAEASNPKAVMPGSTYTVIGSIVTEQLKDKWNGVAMTDEEMAAHIARNVAEHGPPTGADKVRQALDAAISAQRGSTGAKSNRPPVVSQNLDEAIEALYRALGDASPEAQAAFDKELADARARQGAAEARKSKKKAA